MIDTNDFATAIHEQQRKREQARLEAQRKYDVKSADESRQVLPIERIQKPEPIA